MGPAPIGSGGFRPALKVNSCTSSIRLLPRLFFGRIKTRSTREHKKASLLARAFGFDACPPPIPNGRGRRRGWAAG
jgi:hypothetical protein